MKKKLKRFWKEWGVSKFELFEIIIPFILTTFVLFIIYFLLFVFGYNMLA